MSLPWLANRNLWLKIVKLSQFWKRKIMCCPVWNKPIEGYILVEFFLREFGTFNCRTCIKIFFRTCFKINYYRTFLLSPFSFISVKGSNEWNGTQNSLSGKEGWKIYFYNLWHLWVKSKWGSLCSWWGSLR